MPPGTAPNIAITGGTGMIGHALIPVLTAAGHRVRKVTRHPREMSDIGWGPDAGRLDTAPLEALDAVIHLAGESIAGGRWTEEQKRKIMDSRLKGTTLLAETLARLKRPPKVLISASAIGIYGDRGSEVLTEQSGIRTGRETFFVERVGHAWEAATEPAERAGIRVVRTRFGLILTRAGGVLPQIMRPFQFFVGGKLGDGQQYMSWIAIDDVTGALLHAISSEALSGPVNLTAPNPVTNAEFSETLARVIHRPNLFTVPAPVLRLVLGEMADELVLASARVIPERLRESGYHFQFTTLEEALNAILKTNVSSRA